MKFTIKCVAFLLFSCSLTTCVYDRIEIDLKHQNPYSFIDLHDRDIPNMPDVWQLNDEPVWVEDDRFILVPNKTGEYVLEGKGPRDVTFLFTVAENNANIVSPKYMLRIRPLLDSVKSFKVDGAPGFCHFSDDFLQELHVTLQKMEDAVVDDSILKEFIWSSGILAPKTEYLEKAFIDGLGYRTQTWCGSRSGVRCIVQVYHQWTVELQNLAQQWLGMRMAIEQNPQYYHEHDKIIQYLDYGLLTHYMMWRSLLHYVANLPISLFRVQELEHPDDSVYWYSNKVYELRIFLEYHNLRGWNNPMGEKWQPLYAGLDSLGEHLENQGFISSNQGTVNFECAPLKRTVLESYVPNRAILYAFVPDKQDTLYFELDRVNRDKLIWRPVFYSDTLVTDILTDYTDDFNMNYTGSVGKHRFIHHLDNSLYDEFEIQSTGESRLTITQDTQQSVEVKVNYDWPSGIEASVPVTWFSRNKMIGYNLTRRNGLAQLKHTFTETGSVTVYAIVGDWRGTHFSDIPYQYDKVRFNIDVK